MLPLDRPFAARTARISVSATAAGAILASRLRAEGHDLVDFGVGEPDFPTPEHIQEAARQALRDHLTKYTPTGGTAALKDAIAQSHRRGFGSDYGADEILVTDGGKHALFNAISVLIDHGDEVILPAPYWVSFRDQITYAGGRAVIVAADEERGFALDLAAVAAAITPRTKAILLNSPCNPSGAVFSPELFRGVLELCRRHGLWLLSDECYAQLVYEGAPYSAASEPGSRDFLVIAGTLSKTYAMTGWRLGYALAPKPVIAAMLNLQSQSTGNANSIAQHAAIAALAGTQEPVERMRAEYHQRRDLMVSGLRAIAGVECHSPAGAFYVFPNVRALLGRPGGPNDGPKDAVELASRLLREVGVVVVPGEAFGTAGHIRFSYACSRATIQAGLDRFARFRALLK